MARNNNDFLRWGDIEQTMMEYHGGLVMSKFLTIDDCRNARFAVEGALYELEDVPAVDAIPVVRCKACEHQQMCKLAQRLGEDGYCSEGERKEDG